MTACLASSGEVAWVRLFTFLILFWNFSCMKTIKTSPNNLITQIILVFLILDGSQSKTFAGDSVPLSNYAFTNTNKPGKPKLRTPLCFRLEGILLHQAHPSLLSQGGIAPSSPSPKTSRACNKSSCPLWGPWWSSCYVSNTCFHVNQRRWQPGSFQRQIRS